MGEGVYDDEETEDEGEPDDERVLEETPADPDLQIQQLRQMDQQADISLAANKAYQNELLAIMKRLDAAKKRTVELQTLVKGMATELLAGAEMKIVAPGTVEPALPWFKHQYGKNLPPNPDGEARDRYLSTIRWIPWSPSERALLRQEVMAHNHRAIALQAQATGEDLDDLLASTDPSFFVESVAGLDWDKIALVVSRRSALECKMQWLQHDHPLLNFKKWSKDETAKLLEIVEQHEGRDWVAIAEEAGNNRTTWDCVKQYRRRPGQRAEWSKAQDEKLREGVRLYGENWQAVARHAGRNSNQCINRWTKSLKPSIKRGKWTTAEDDALRSAVAAVGQNWKHVAPRVGGRTDAQCRERWTNVLDPRLEKKKEWTERDDALLLAAREDGKGWSVIAHQVFEDTRTDNACMRRHRDLTKQRPPKASKQPRKRSASAAAGASAPAKKRKLKEQTEAPETTLEEEGEAADADIDVDFDNELPVPPPQPRPREFDSSPDPEGPVPARARYDILDFDDDEAGDESVAAAAAAAAIAASLSSQAERRASSSAARPARGKKRQDQADMETPEVVRQKKGVSEMDVDLERPIPPPQPQPAIAGPAELEGPAPAAIDIPNLGDDTDQSIVAAAAAAALAASTSTDQEELPPLPEDPQSLPHVAGRMTRMEVDAEPPAAEAEAGVEQEVSQEKEGGTRRSGRARRAPKKMAE
ncbi:hypothetical protein JCM1840_003233 [Sporobolomyces johnsonii]